MKLVVSAGGEGLDSPVSPVFGRCRYFVFVDSDTLQCESLENPAVNATGGAGIQSARFVLDHGAEAILTGEIGPNAVGVVRAANVPAFRIVEDDTVRKAVEGFKSGRLPPIFRAESEHPPAPVASPTGEPAPVRDASSREREIEDLTNTAIRLRRRLADLGTKIDALERRR